MHNLTGYRIVMVFLGELCSHGMFYYYYYLVHCLEFHKVTFLSHHSFTYPPLSQEEADPPALTRSSR